MTENILFIILSTIYISWIYYKNKNKDDYQIILGSEINSRTVCKKHKIELSAQNRITGFVHQSKT